MTTMTGMTQPAGTYDQAVAVVRAHTARSPLAGYELADDLTGIADRALAHMGRVAGDGTPLGHRDSRPPRDDSEALRPVERS